MGWVQDHSRTIGLMTTLTAIFALLVFAFTFKEPGSLILLLITGVISVFYVLRFKRKNLRELPYIKIYLISLVWVGILIFYPLYNEGRHDLIIYYSLAHFYYVLAVTIPFDIRDLKLDTPTQKTIPQLLGVVRSKILALFLLLVFSVLMLYIDRGLWYNITFYLAISVQASLILLMDEERGDLYCAGGIDGAIALLGLSYFFS